MEMFDSTADRSFRSEVRSFFKDSVPDHIRQRSMTGLPLDRPMLEEWHEIVLTRGMGHHHPITLASHYNRHWGRLCCHCGLLSSGSRAS